MEQRKPNDLKWLWFSCTKPVTVRPYYRPIVERECKLPEHPGQNYESQRAPESHSSLSEGNCHYLPTHLDNQKVLTENGDKCQPHITANASILISVVCVRWGVGGC